MAASTSSLMSPISALNPKKDSPPAHTKRHKLLHIVATDKEKTELDDLDTAIKRKNALV
jgi:hypothetical protein